MTIAFALTSLNQDIQNARTAIINKGGTVTTNGGSSQLATDIATIPTTSIKKYQLLDRIKDDSNNEIGTVSGFFTDANDVEYAVVCLDAQYRNASTQWCSDNNSIVTNMPVYNNLINENIWEAKETATQNTQLILDYCLAGGYTSTSCSHCRSKSFTIEGTTYYGQLPNMIEVVHLIEHYNELDMLDTSASTHSSTNFSSTHYFWSSSQSGISNCWCIGGNGTVYHDFKTSSLFACPVLEIPNQ